MGGLSFVFSSVVGVFFLVVSVLVWCTARTRSWGVGAAQP